MIKKKWGFFFVAFIFGMFATKSYSATIDFNEFNSGQWFNPGGSISSGGFDIQATTANLHRALILQSSDCGPPCPDNGDYYLGYARDNTNNSYIFTEASNQTFSLNSFDGAEFHKDLSADWATDIVVTGVKNDATVVTQSFQLDFLQDGSGAGNDFQNFSLSAVFNDLVSVEFKGYKNGLVGGQWSMDNVTVNEVAPVPEPGTFLLLGFGFAGLTLYRRKTGR